MDTASDLHFNLTITRIIYKDNMVPSKGCFYYTEEEAWESSDGFEIEENEEVKICFKSDDSSSRFYLDALDIALSDNRVSYDEEGRLYLNPSDEEFILYRNDDKHDALCVDTFLITILCHGQLFYSTLSVVPKPLSENEWIMMKDDLEKEVTGLAQDLLRRKLGSGKKSTKSTPSKMLRDFMIMQKYSSRLLPALIDISENPRYQIVTRYKKVTDTKNSRLDEKSVRRYITRAGSESFYQVPEKIISYDIQDNRVLKTILKDYESRLTNLQEVLENSVSEQSNEAEIHGKEWEDSIRKVADEAGRLKRITSLIHLNDWYSSIKDMASPYVAHSLFMDSRYNVLYQMYNEMRSDEFRVGLELEYSYTWKRSSYLYEMWCFIKVCRILEQSFTNVSGDIINIFMSKMLFPFLESGSKVTFSDSYTKLEVIFDKKLPNRKEDTSLSEPLYIAASDGNRHNKPDILINAYDKRNGWYIGSIILECKYRKLRSFWKGSDWSSVNQFQTYSNNSRSKFLFDGKASRTTTPVNRVIVLTPDQNGDGKKDEDFYVEVRGLKPADDDEWLKGLKNQLLDVLKEMKGDELKLI